MPPPVDLCSGCAGHADSGSVREPDSDTEHGRHFMKLRLGKYVLLNKNKFVSGFQWMQGLGIASASEIKPSKTVGKSNSLLSYRNSLSGVFY